MTRIGDQIDQRRHVFGWPIAGHQLFFGVGGRRREADQLDHVIDVGNRDREPDQDVGPVARLGQLVLDAAGDDVLAERCKRRDHVLEIEAFGPPAVNRQHVGAERRLQIRELVEVVQHDIGDSIALQLDDDANAFAVALVPKVRDAFYSLVAHQIGDLFDQHALVHLIGNFGDDQRFAILADVLGFDARSHDDRAARLVVGEQNAAAPEYHRSCREIRPRDDLAQFVDGDFRVVEIGDAGIDHFAEIMRRNVGCHADRDTARTVDEQVWKLGWQHRRLEQPVVVVRFEIDRLVVEIVEQRHRDLGQARFRVALGGGRIAVDRAEVSLAIDQRHAQRKVLRHAHQRIINRQVAVRMEVAHHIADHLGRLDVLLVKRQAQPVHSVEDAAMHRLQAIPDIGQRARNNHAHRVVEIRALHLFRDGDRAGIVRLFAGWLVVVASVGQGVLAIAKKRPARYAVTARREVRKSISLSLQDWPPQRQPCGDVPRPQPPAIYAVFSSVWRNHRRPSRGLAKRLAPVTFWR